jgi:hypothetical protein
MPEKKEDNKTDEFEELFEDDSKSNEKIKENEKKEEIEDELLIENDGDFFWVLQRVIWGIVKTLFLLGIIIVLVWHVWWNNDISDKVKKITQPTETQKKENIIKKSEKSIWDKLTNVFSSDKKNSVKIINKVGSNNVNNSRNKREETHQTSINKNQINNYELPKSQNSQKIIHDKHAIKAASLIYGIEQRRVFAKNSVFTESIKWLREAKGLADINLNFYIERHKNPKEAIGELLFQTRDLITKNGIIQSKLLADMTEFNIKSEEEKVMALQLDEKLFQKISRLESSKIDKILQEKIQHEQLYIKYQSEVRIRQTLIKNMRGFEQNLRKKVLYLVNPAQKTEIRSSKF